MANNFIPPPPGATLSHTRSTIPYRSDSDAFLSLSNQPFISNTTGSPQAASVQGTVLEAKRIDKAYSPSSGEWELWDSAEPITRNKENTYAKYTEYALLVERQVEQARDSDIPSITTAIILQSDILINVIKGVMKAVQKISWNLRPFKVIDPQLLLMFLPRFKTKLTHREPALIDDDPTTKCLVFLIDFLETEYATILRQINTLISDAEITFDLLWAILIPQSILFTQCEVTSAPRAVRLREISQDIQRDLNRMDGVPYWLLVCEYVDVNEDPTSQDQPFGLAKLELKIHGFNGVAKISDLNVYPLQWHHDNELQEKLIKRGRKWVALNGMHHVYYDGVAYRFTREGFTERYNKLTVNGRVMIDRKTFADVNPNYQRPPAAKNLFDHMFSTFSPDARKGSDGAPILKQVQDTEDHNLLLASPILYGFSFPDKRWLEFNVEHVGVIRWGDELFGNLAIDPHRKILLRSLVESHGQDQSVDDFVEGKGLGLVFKLFGPPGVGKSLTVEAISEHLHKPLYVVGAGDLGTDASTLDSRLTDLFYVASEWKAIVLIDEADVFLEERGAAKLERNAMVAVFLRQIEYFRGILFLTTNRITTFDPAFQSRIHLSLQYAELSTAAKEHIWLAFLKKARNSPLGIEDLNTDQMRELSGKELNGREIKNAVKLAVSLANRESEPLGFRHLVQTMAVMDGVGVQHTAGIIRTDNKTRQWSRCVLM